MIIHFLKTDQGSLIANVQVCPSQLCMPRLDIRKYKTKWIYPLEIHCTCIQQDDVAPLCLISYILQDLLTHTHTHVGENKNEKLLAELRVGHENKMEERGVDILRNAYMGNISRRKERWGM